MVKRNRIIIGISTALLGGAAVAVPVAIAKTQTSSPVATTLKATSAANEIPPEDTPRAYYNAGSVNATPGPSTTAEALTPPSPPVFTDTGTLWYGAKNLPLPKLPVPAAGYGTWSPNITYTAEGTNETVTNATLPTLAAGTVVLATSIVKPADGHSGSPYAGTVRFVIQRLKAVRPDASTLQSSSYAVLTTLFDGVLPARGLVDFVPPSLEQKGYLPWSDAYLTKTYTDNSGSVYSLDTASDWAAMANRFRYAQGDTLFTVNYVWTTAVDKNHYVSLGDDQSVSYQYKVAVKKQTTIVMNRTNPNGTIADGVKVAMFYLEGRKAQLTTMNQFGTFAYTVKRSDQGASIGGIQPHQLLMTDTIPVSVNGVTYPTTTSGSFEIGERVFHTSAFLTARSLSADQKSDYRGDFDYWKGTQYVNQTMNLSQIDIPGADFSIGERIPADSAVAASPLVAVKYAADSVDAAVRLVTQMKVKYSYMNATYLSSPEVFTDPDLADQIPTVGELQRYMNAPYIYNGDFETNWRSETTYQNPAKGQADIRSWARSFYPYSLMTTKQLWFRNYDLKTEQAKIPNELDFLPLTLNSNAATLGSAVWEQSPYSFTSANNNTDLFDLTGFDATQIVAGQFFDVASLNFVPKWENYPTQQKSIVRANLFDPDTTQLKVGAYVQYKDGLLQFYLIPYIPNLPKINFANSSPTAFPINRDLGFSYEFQNVSVSIDRFNAPLGGF